MLKNIIKGLTVSFFLGGVSQLWGACPLQVQNLDINPKPLDYKGLGNITFSMKEDTGREVPALNGNGDPTCEFNVDLSYVKLKDISLESVSGTILSYFDVTYNPAISSGYGRLHFTQKTLFPADGVADSNITVDVTAQSTIEQKFNGFELNVTTSAVEGSAFTYTNQAVVLATNDSNNSVDGVSGGIAIANITTNDTINGVPVTLGTDVNITSITNTTVLVVDPVTGSVSVPADTAEGTYIENYEICEIYDTNNCSNGTITVTVNRLVTPDYRPILTVYGGIVHGEGVHTFSFDTLVKNVISEGVYDNTKPLRIVIPKNEALVLTFDSETTTFKGETVENNLWSFDDSDQFDYFVTYTGSEMSAGKSRFSIQGTLTVEAGEISKFFLEATIKSTTGGDNNIDNNSDRETLQKRL